MQTRNKNRNFNDRFVNNFPQKSEHALQVYKTKRKKITCDKISHQNGRWSLKPVKSKVQNEKMGVFLGVSILFTIVSS